LKEEISTLFCEVFSQQLGVMPKKVTTLIYNNKIIAFTTDCLKEHIHCKEEKRMDIDNQRNFILNKFEYYKPSIKKKIEKNFDCNIDKLDLFVGTNGIYLAHIILYEPLER
jgi:hypothetical protein